MRFPGKKLYRFRFLCDCPLPEMPHPTDHEGYNLAVPGAFLQTYGVYFECALKLICTALSFAPNSIIPDGCEKLLQELASVLHIDVNNLKSIIEKGEEDKIDAMIADSDAANIVKSDKRVKLAGPELRQLAGL